MARPSQTRDGEDLFRGTGYMINIFSNSFIFTGLLVRIFLAILPLFFSFWILGDAAKRQIKFYWWWALTVVVSSVYLPLMFFILLAYLFHRRSRGITKKKIIVKLSDKVKIVAVYFGLSILVALFIVFYIPLKVSGLWPWQLEEKSNSEEVERLKQPPRDKVTLFGHRYVLRNCPDKVPDGYAFYQKHVLGWNVYVVKEKTFLPAYQRPTFDNIILESPGLWICVYPQVPGY